MTFADRIRALEDQQGGPEEDYLLYEAVIAYAPAGTNPGVNQTFKAFLESGRSAYHKPFSGVASPYAYLYQHHPDELPINECAAWRLAVQLGPQFTAVVAPTVLREIEGEAGSLSAEQIGFPHDARPLAQAPDQCLASAFVDSLIAQQDRHSGNYRWDDAQHKLGLIDHGYTLALPGHTVNGTLFTGWRWGQGSQQLDAAETRALERLLASNDLLGLREFLLPDRADALQSRAERMLQAGTILRVGQY